MWHRFGVEPTLQGFWRNAHIEKEEQDEENWSIKSLKYCLVRTRQHFAWGHLQELPRSFSRAAAGAFIH